ncbi:MAG: voltage-gated potassium channel [Mycobacterium sp.]|jgi:voltage-gated potassium channel|nr:voltage-gated potassium channel [Cryptosporangiaceae bacterium]MDT5016276.1 voltage-gated potassium channel [Mycobacterium sp.]
MSRLQEWERRTGPTLTALAVTALLALVLEAAWNLAAWPITLIDYAVWALFVADYAVRVRLAPRRWEFVRAHPLDLLAVMVPVFRSLRLIATVARVSAVSRRGSAEQVIARTVLIALTVVLAGAAIGVEAERAAPGATITTFGDGLWWALTTVTTVGYGDRIPITPEGRVVGGILMIVGIASMGAVSAAITARLIRDSEIDDPDENTLRLQRVERELARVVSLLESERNEGR